MKRFVSGSVASLNNTRTRVLENIPFRRKSNANDEPPVIGRRSLGRGMLSSVAAHLRPAVAGGSAADSIDLDGSAAHPVDLDEDDSEAEARDPEAQDIEHFALRALDPQEECHDALLSVFPGICPQFLRKICMEYSYNYNNVASIILDRHEGGKTIPRRVEPVGSTSKRKRLLSDSATDNSGVSKQLRRDAGRGKPENNGVESDDDEEDVATAQAAQAAEVARAEAEALRMCPDGDNRQRHKMPSVTPRLGVQLFQQMFPHITKKSAGRLLQQHNRCLLRALLAFDADLARDPPETKRQHCKHRMTVPDPELALDKFDNLIASANEHSWVLLEEYRAVARVRGLREAKRVAEEAHIQAERANFARAERDGSLQDCQCCYDAYAMNRMVHCDGGAALHWFCKDCARRMAETQIGLSKYALECMSTDGCAAGFSRDQQRQFLGRKTRAALDRLEMEDSLRQAGLDSLETCPFCPFAAEYPPTEEDREFRCLRPECGAVSCRLCRKKTHVPKTCEESVKDAAGSVRLSIEEAMSEAMIRRCNKCHTPFIKAAGCNKMMCTRPGCGNVQCYVCSKSCDYKHFDDKARGGKPGNCPLFESVEQRHSDEVRVAEESALRAAQEEHPDIDPASLRIAVSEAVLADERQRMQRSQPPQPPY